VNEKSSCPHDPFKEARLQQPILSNDFNGETIPMILRHKDVREAAKDWKTFSSNIPFRVPIPSEEDVRNVRQLPIETDPPEHTEYRKIVEPFFRRPLQAKVIQQVESLVGELILDAAKRKRIEIVRDFALPLQSRALTYLLNVPEPEADTWIGWGTHVFRDGVGKQKGAVLDNYIHAQLNRAESEPSDDFFSALCQARYQGRLLTREEKVGYANLAFAGGRDTIINSVAGIIAHISQHGETLDFLREDPKRIMTASEEFVRVISPLTHIGRNCPMNTNIHETNVSADHRISLCWASANFDEAVFDAPEEVRLDRRPNPHIAYGAGAHTCLGIHHSRLIIRALLKTLCAYVQSIDLIDSEENVENEAEYQRKVGYHQLFVNINAS